MRADPDGPSCVLREPTIRVVLDRMIAVEFFSPHDTEPAATDALLGPSVVAAGTEVGLALGTDAGIELGLELDGTDPPTDTFEKLVL